MTSLVFVGQAPARSGDGRAFSGPSGNRLCRLLDLSNYEALAARVGLENLILHQVEKAQSGRGDTFDRGEAVKRARSLTLNLAARAEHVVVIACGHEVYRMFTNRQSPFFTGVAAVVRPAETIDIWNFPHPSGASAFWNEPQNARNAKKFLDQLVTHYGIDMAR